MSNKCVSTIVRDLSMTLLGHDYHSDCRDDWLVPRLLRALDLSLDLVKSARKIKREAKPKTQNMYRHESVRRLRRTEEVATVVNSDVYRLVPGPMRVGLAGFNNNPSCYCFINQQLCYDMAAWCGWRVQNQT